MIKTNLASRPFYDDRTFRLVAGAVVVALVALTAFNDTSLIRLSAQQARLGAHAADAEREAARLKAEAARVRTRIDPREVATVAAAAHEANDLIDRRTFSWTGLFGQLENTLPADVRIRAVQPRIDQGVFRVVVSAQAKRIVTLEAFIVALEKTGTFSAVTPLEETSGEGGVIDAVVEGVYRTAGKAER